MLQYSLQSKSTDDEATTAKDTNVELNVMRLEIQEVGSNEVRKLRT